MEFKSEHTGSNNGRNIVFIHQHMVVTNKKLENNATEITNLTKR